MRKYVVLVIILIAAALLLAGCSILDGYDDGDMATVDKSGMLAVNGIDAIKIDADVATVNFRLGKDAVNIHYHLYGKVGVDYARNIVFDAGCEAGKLNVVLRRDKNSGGKQRGKYGNLTLDVELPEKNYAALEAKLVIGGFNVDGLHCANVDVYTETGSINVRRLDAKNIKLGAETGSINVDGYRGELSCATQTGSMEVYAREIANDVSLQSETGSVTLRVANPPEDPMLLLKTGSGSISCGWGGNVGTFTARKEFRRDSGSPRIILQTSTGSVSLE